MKFAEWDYDQIVKEFCYIREKPIDDHVKEQLKDELRKLEFHGWPVICDVAESIMLNGRYALNNSMWLIVRNAVRDKIAQIKNQKYEAPAVPKYKQIGNDLLSLHNAINAEIQVWLRFKVPLKYKGIPVVKRTDYYHPPFFDLDNWDRVGRPELENVLIDEYFTIYYESMVQEELQKVDGIIDSHLEKFLNLLKKLRVAQVKL